MLQEAKKGTQITGTRDEVSCRAGAKGFSRNHLQPLFKVSYILSFKTLLRLRKMRFVWRRRREQNLLRKIFMNVEVIMGKIENEKSSEPRMDCIKRGKKPFLGSRRFQISFEG